MPKPKEMWKLSCCFPFELEESIIWKLNQLSITRYAIKYEPNPINKCVLFIWLTDAEYSDQSREFFISLIEPLGETFGLHVGPFTWEKIVDQDWSLSWKSQWKPDPVGNTLLILPAWLEIPEIHSSRIAVKIDPGSAFGTGSHPTTRLCLEALENDPPIGKTVADLGCGSGVLGFAALGLGAKQVFSVDNDSLAINSTRENCKLNALSRNSFKAVIGSVPELKEMLNGGPADLLVCNILAPIIENLSAGFTQLVAKNGTALLSGILISQVDGVINTLQPFGWNCTSLQEKEGWVLIEVTKE